MFVGNCEGIWGWLFGHHFEPRTTTTEAPNSIFIGAKVEGGRYDAGELRRLMIVKQTIYHGDCCTRCGAIINAPTSTDP